MPEKKQKVLRLRIPPRIRAAGAGGSWTMAARSSLRPSGWVSTRTSPRRSKKKKPASPSPIFRSGRTSPSRRCSAQWRGPRFFRFIPSTTPGTDIHGGPSSEGLEVIGSYIDESNSDDVFEALWAAYLLSVDPKKREAADKWMAEVKAVKAKAENAGVPAGPVETASTDTPISIDSAARSTATATDQTESAVSP